MTIDNYIPDRAIIHPEKEEWYRVHVIPKRSGGTRIIEEPADWLKAAQRDIYENILLPNYRINEHAYGSIKGRNISDAAALHVESAKVLRMDLSDFFWSVTVDRIETCLLYNKDLDPTSLSQVAYLCTNKYGILPQGGVTSPALANIVASPLYALLGKVADTMHLKFSAYLDDLIFSGDAPAKIIPVASKLIKNKGFKINDKKTCVMSGKQEVLGLCVVKDIDHPRLPRRKRDKIRGLLHKLSFQVKYNSVDYAMYKYLEGLVAFSNMAKDQKSEMFKAKLDSLKLKIKGMKNVTNRAENRNG